MSSIMDKPLIKYIVLHIILVLFSFCGVLSKSASGAEFLSLRFCVFYGLMIFILGVYAIVWQQLLKYFNLSTAFCNQAVTIIWGMLWGKLFFCETIKWNMILGAVIVIAGVILVVKSDE